MAKKKFSHTLGKGLAYLQDGVDRLIGLGFNKLKSTGDKKPQKNTHPVKKGLLNVAAFLGDMGSSFYDEYEGIKEKRRKQNKK